MKIDMISGLESRLAHSEDAVQLDEGHWALDMYDVQPPMALELRFGKQSLEVLAAAELSYSDELDGYYMSGRVTDCALVRQKLMEWMQSDA